MKIFKWIGTAFLFIVGVFFSTKHRRHKQRAERLTEDQIKQENSTKQSSLQKAKDLSIQADKEFEKAHKAKQKSKNLQMKLENKNEINLADRIKSFNDSL